MIDLSPWWGIPVGMIAFYIWVEHFSHRLSVKRPGTETPDYIVELWQEEILAQYKKESIMAKLKGD